MSDAQRLIDKASEFLTSATEAGSQAAHDAYLNISQTAALASTAISLNKIAEQQRIANLIGLAESGRITTRGAHAALSALYDGRVEDGTARMSLSPDIAAALGIEAAS